MQKKWVRIIFRRRVFVIFLLLLQALLMGFLVYTSSISFKWIYNLLNLISLSVVLHIVTTKMRTSFKLVWSIMILLFPLFGGLLYVLVRFQSLNMAFKSRLFSAQKETALAFRPYLKEKMEPSEVDSLWSCQQRLLTKNYGFHAFYNEKTEFLPSGEAKLERLLSLLEQAESFIFLEYFIIRDGVMWKAVEEILKRKAAGGVDIRIIYDDLGCFTGLPLTYPKDLADFGIKCVVFNKFRPALSTLQNNRDHRKIAVIDGKWAFTGGVNLADEYINAIHKHGHWKDAAILVSGQAVAGFTLMFLDMWQALTGEKSELSSILPALSPPEKQEGVIIPYCDSPIDEDYVGEQVYMNMINNARKYLYIQTPYLILDDNMVAALILAAKNGVDVRIITPYRPDKWYAHMTTRSYYRELLSGGVKVFEYTPGFIHAKVMVADDISATVGTINLDCRSLYLHFECGAWLYGCQAISDIREDFIKTQGRCRLITEKNYKVGFFKRILQKIFRLFAPLL